MEKMKMAPEKVKELIKEEIDRFNVATSNEYNDELILEIRGTVENLNQKIAKFLIKSKKKDQKIYESNLMKVNEQLANLNALINSLEKK